MDLKSYSLEGWCFVWEVLITGNKLIQKSSIFSFDGSKWCFELKIAWNSLCKEDLWTIKINKLDRMKKDCKFQVRVQVESRIGEFQYLKIANVEYPGNWEQLLFEQSKSFLLRCHSNVKWEEKIKLIFTIYNSIFSTEELEWKSKPHYGVPDFFANKLSFPGSTKDETFFLDTDKQDKHLPDITKEDKLVQTSSSMNVLPCLENLSRDMEKLMDKDSQHDGEIRCGDCILPVHRLIIGARSEVFKAMMQNDMIENHTGSIHVSDIEFPVLKHFLRYLYTGNLPDLTTDVVTELYETGDKYAMDSLKKRCSDLLKESLDRSNACKILTIADAHNDVGLKEGAIDFILENVIHQEEDEWTVFCNNQPKLANEVLNRAFKSLKFSKKQ